MFMGGPQQLELSKQVNNSRVIRDQKLNWGPQITRVIDTGKQTLRMYRRVDGQTLSLNSKIMLWLYTAVVRPAFTNGAIVWWPRIKVQMGATKLTSVQRLVCFAMKANLCSTPKASFDSYLHIMLFNKEFGQ